MKIGTDNDVELRMHAAQLRQYADLLGSTALTTAKRDCVVKVMLDVSAAIDPGATIRPIPSEATS